MAHVREPAAAHSTPAQAVGISFGVAAFLEDSTCSCPLGHLQFSCLWANFCVDGVSYGKVGVSVDGTYVLALFDGQPVVSGDENDVESTPSIGAPGGLQRSWCAESSSVAVQIHVSHDAGVRRGFHDDGDVGRSVHLEYVQVRFSWSHDAQPLCAIGGHGLWFALVPLGTCGPPRARPHDHVKQPGPREASHGAHVLVLSLRARAKRWRRASSDHVEPLPLRPSSTEEKKLPEGGPRAPGSRARSDQWEGRAEGVT
mmetsp:Transcript_7586/g.46663  ORF Transcript_7586/g.46663 Transcript_7586/m.46663 type:complete len:256 (-) Transcript_7586:4014-4781(-)